MALFVMLFRKMVQNNWLTVSLLLGLVCSVAIVSAIPIYTDSIMSRMLVKDMERLQADKQVYPGTYWAQMGLSAQTMDQSKDQMNQADSFMQDEAAPSFHLPIRDLVVTRTTAQYDLVPEDPRKADPNVKRTVNVASMSGFREHIRLIDGRMPAEQPDGGVYEVLVTESALRQLKMVIGNVFIAQDKEGRDSIKLKPVGVFEQKSWDDIYFRNDISSTYAATFFMDKHLFDRELLQNGKLKEDFGEWYFILEYTHMSLQNVNEFVETSAWIKNWVNNRNDSALGNNFSAPALELLSAYSERAGNLRMLVVSLNVPVLIMLGFYMFMVSNMILQRQKNEIAVLRSRGASRLQILLTYSLEGLLLCAVAYGAGPFLGLGLSQILGAPNGFLALADRTSLLTRLTADAFLYGLAAAVCSLIMLLIPAWFATRFTIVGHKQDAGRLNKPSVWHRYFLDIIALGVAFYGLNTFQARLTTLQSLGLQTADLSIDPLQFIVPALFILGAGLLMLRLYPLLLRGVYAAGRSWWPPAWYSALIQVGRSITQYQYLMLFLVLTVATGVFSASAARTINNNVEDRVRYGNGADIVLEVPWINDASAPSTGRDDPQPTAPGPQRIHYKEPAFEPFRTLPGVEESAKVFVKNRVHVTAPSSYGSVTLMGIDTDEFGRTAWFRDGLLDYPLNAYLNLMASDSKAVLISRTMAETMKVEIGDSIGLGWDGVGQRMFVVYGIIDYFPTFNPNPDRPDQKNDSPMLVIGHLQRIQTQLALEPYQVWLNMKAGYSLADFYQAIADRQLAVASITETATEVRQAVSDPFLAAVNGVLTLGFIVSISISFIGFLLYWILAMRGRTLHNGILRAMGLPLRSLVMMLSVEQVLTSGAAVLIGMVSGTLASLLFVPAFQTAFDVRSMVPPFLVMFNATDSVRLYVIVGIMIAVGLSILGLQLSRLKIHQALKLGED